MLRAPSLLIALLWTAMCAHGCDGDAPVASPVSPFAEFLDRGLGRYLGRITPKKTIRDGALTHFEFDVADGPMCIRGAPYGTTTRDGDGDALLIFLQGGGACWSALCIAFEEVSFQLPTVGILNADMPGNPVRDWDVGYVPYCDGSLFSGDAEVDDDGDGAPDRLHRGLANLTAALEAIKSRYPAPSRVVLTGISAGAYGTMFSAMLSRSIWPGVPIDVVADGGVGLGKPGDVPFIRNILDEWGITPMLPESCEGCLDDGHVTGYASWALARDPQLRYAAISSVGDFVIGTMFLGLGAQAYEAALRAEAAELSAAHPDQFAYFLFEGDRHTTLAVDAGTDLSGVSLPFPGGESLDGILGRFDETAIDGVTVKAWLTAWLAEAPTFESLAVSP